MQPNGRITLAVIATKLDHISGQITDLQDTVKQDHDRLGKVESAIEDFTILKRIILSYGVGLVITMALALYAIVQTTFP